MAIMEEFLSYLRAQVGHIYVWGAQGETVTDPAWIKRKETTPLNGARAVSLYDKRRQEGKDPIKAYDCSGLIVCFLLKHGLITYDMSSRELYRKSEAITRADLQPGDLVFRHNGVRIYHVGVYMGNGRVIESKGRDDGVVERDINASGSKYWNRFGRFTPLQEAKGSPRVLRLASPMLRGDDVERLQLALTYLGFDPGDVDGVYGTKTDKALRDFQAYASAMKQGICDDAARKVLGL